MMHDRNITQVEPVQQIFAHLLLWFVRVALVVLFASFVLYAAGVVPSEASIGEVPELWHLSADEYAAQVGLETGWGWTRTLGDGRGLAFAALVFFPAGTIVLIAVTAALYIRHREPHYALLAFLELVVLVIAASGIISRGG